MRVGQSAGPRTEWRQSAYLREHYSIVGATCIGSSQLAGPLSIKRV